MIHDLALRWVVTWLFALSAAECVHSIVKGRHSAVSVVGHSLHAIMAVAMAVMAWPAGAGLPTLAPMLFFLGAAVWFAAVAFATDGHRGASAYHSLMMLAMSWMYAAMGGLSLSPATAGGHGGHDGHAGHAGHGGHMTDDGPAMGGGTGQYAWVGVLNWLCTIGFALATAYWLYRYFAAGRGDGGSGRHFGLLCQAAMAAGMAIMFGVML